MGVSFATLNLVLGPKRLKDPTTSAGLRQADPYECGLPSEISKTFRFGVSFYLVAMLFILFDIEIVFMYPWAVVYRDFLAQQGSIIFWSMTGFVTVLTIGYIYAIKKGALDWRN